MKQFQRPIISQEQPPTLPELVRFRTCLSITCARRRRRDLPDGESRYPKLSPQRERPQLGHAQQEKVGPRAGLPGGAATAVGDPWLTSTCLGCPPAQGVGQEGRQILWIGQETRSAPRRAPAARCGDRCGARRNSRRSPATCCGERCGGLYAARCGARSAAHFASCRAPAAPRGDWCGPRGTRCGVVDASSQEVS